jgi:hypothetical protein
MHFIRQYNLKIIFSVIIGFAFFPTLASSSSSISSSSISNSSASSSQSPANQGAKSKAEQDKINIARIQILLKQHQDSISSAHFPIAKDHGKYNKELSEVFIELKALYQQLAAKAKHSFKVSSYLCRALIKTAECILQKINVSRDPNFIATRTASQMHNLKTQLELQHSMMNWFNSIIDNNTRYNQAELTFDANQEFAQSLQKITLDELEVREQEAHNPNHPLEYTQALLMHADISDTPNVNWNPESHETLPENVRHGLIQAQEYTPGVLDFFNKNPQTLLTQDEQGWTPLMIAASQGHIEMLASLSNIIVRNHYADTQTAYTRKLKEKNDTGRYYPAEFVCLLYPLEDLAIEDPLSSSKKNRAFCLLSGKYRPFECLGDVRPRATIPIDLKTYAAHRLRSFHGLGAYIFVSSLARKALTYRGNIRVLDDIPAHNAIAQEQQKYAQDLRQELAKTFTDNVFNVTVLHTLIQSYVATDLPLPQIKEARS